jgi:DNA-binding protein H-NS
MAWERRERGGLYYTRSRKVDGHVVREYVGSGSVGELAAQMDALEQLRREKEAAAWKEEREQMDKLESSVEEMCEAAEILAQAALYVAGYHKHNRGEWRKKRAVKQR